MQNHRSSISSIFIKQFPLFNTNYVSVIIRFTGTVLKPHKLSNYSSLQRGQS